MPDWFEFLTMLLLLIATFIVAYYFNVFSKNRFRLADPKTAKTIRESLSIRLICKYYLNII